MQSCLCQRIFLVAFSDLYLHGLFCAGLKLGLFGFVFTKCPIGFIFIIRCIIDVYVHLTFSEIGFVLHKRSDL